LADMAVATPKPKTDYEGILSENAPPEQAGAHSCTYIRFAVVVGLVSDICEYATANGFGIRGYKLILPRNCTATRDDYGRDLFFRQTDLPPALERNKPCN
jgi:hypothetical protein